MHVQKEIFNCVWILVKIHTSIETVHQNSHILSNSVCLIIDMPNTLFMAIPQMPQIGQEKKIVI